ncbi:hypothetical protein [Dactylosporangium fulvum]|uniref:Uncharacterized protein n=1 Tax=Dactylosporangium fulvum TaxID=53359 RepID=A0ABY5VPF4_9ACTN|nr:hypothetical protein [Dactylosporangium fulvum]UWP79055.1 hypothetical protein Dfulv_28240 [Dactylosporangium fulvum]
MAAASGNWRFVARFATPDQLAAHPWSAGAWQLGPPFGAMDGQPDDRTARISGPAALPPGRQDHADNVDYPAAQPTDADFTPTTSTARTRSAHTAPPGGQAATGIAEAAASGHTTHAPAHHPQWTNTRHSSGGPARQTPDIPDILVHRRTVMCSTLHDPEDFVHPSQHQPFGIMQNQENCIQPLRCESIS